MSARWVPAAGLIVMSSLAAVPAHAQQASPIRAGGWIIGGSAGFFRSHDDISDQTTTSVSLQPTALLFVADRFAVGGTLPLSYSTLSTGHSTNYGIGPSARYYFGDPAGNLFPFVSASVVPQRSSVHHDATPIGGGGSIPASDATNDIVVIDGSVGLTRLLATNVGVTGEAYYTHVSFDSKSGSTSTSHGQYNYGLRFGLTVFAR